MPLRQLIQQSTGSMNPSYLTNTLPGGAGAATTGVTPNPGISSPFIEVSVNEVQDVTAPTTLSAVLGATTLGTPAAAGKLLVTDYNNSGPGGWLWKQSAARYAPLSGGQYGVVYKPAGTTVNGNFINGSIAQGSAGGNIALPGDRALVVTDGATNALVNTSVFGSAISAGMPLAADGGGNLTGINQGTVGTTAGANTPPLPGVILATALAPVAANISIPVLVPVYVGGR